MILYCFIIAILHRFRGGGIIKNPTSNRRVISSILIGVISGIMLTDLYQYYHTLIVISIITVGYYLSVLSGTGDTGLLAITGRFDGKLNKSVLNTWVYFITDYILNGTPDNTSRQFNRKWGAVAMSIRGLYRLVITTVLAILYHTPLISLFGLLGVLSGIVYYKIGSLGENKYSVTIAELLDGWLYAIMIYLCIRGYL